MGRENRAASDRPNGERRTPFSIYQQRHKYARSPRAPKEYTKNTRKNNLARHMWYSFVARKTDFTCEHPEVCVRAPSQSVPSSLVSHALPPARDPTPKCIVRYVCGGHEEVIRLLRVSFSSSTTFTCLHIHGESCLNLGCK